MIDLATHQIYHSIHDARIATGAAGPRDMPALGEDAPHMAEVKFAHESKGERTIFPETEIERMERKHDEEDDAAEEIRRLALGLERRRAPAGAPARAPALADLPPLGVAAAAERFESPPAASLSPEEIRSLLS